MKNIADDDQEEQLVHDPLRFYDKLNIRLLKTRTIVVCTSVSAEDEPFFTKLNYLVSEDSKAPITVILNCPGGDVYDGFVIHNAILRARSQGTPVNVEVLGLCASMANIVLQAGTRRIAWKSTRFLLHEVSKFKFFDESTATQAEEEARELGKLNTMLAQIIADRVKKPIDEVLKAIKKNELWLSAEEALIYGLVDEVK
jgi:ATP-dependent Clp protease protease subunit